MRPRPPPVRVLRAARCCDPRAGATQLASPLSHQNWPICMRNRPFRTTGIATIDTTFLGTAAPSPPPAMMAPGELAVDRACGGAGATGGITTSFSRPSSSFPTSLHHDSPAAPWTCSGSIPTVRLNQCCWLMRQGDIPRLSGVDRGLLDVRRAGRRRATLMGLPLERFQAACRGDACDELEVGNPD
eukprot:COSAG03_NODE_1502_length_3973_cov_6.451988_6_plen_186_part_00